MAKNLRAVLGLKGLICLVSIILISFVAAIQLAIYNTPTVTVVTVIGKTWVSEDNTTWQSSEITNLAVGAPWYVKFNTTSSGYSGSVTITWTLKFINGTSVSGVSPTATSFTLNGAAGQTIYATTDGTGPSGNRNWGSDTTDAAQYQVEVKFDSP